MIVLAVLFDIHGNLGALEAVVSDARARGAERFLLGGDYALFGPWPQESIETLRALEPATWIRGNGERWTGAPADAPHDPVVQGAIAASRDTLGPATVTELAGLPEQAEIDGTLFCHASPISDVRSFYPQPGEDEAELLEGNRDRRARLVFGHTHLPFRRTAADGTELVNPGSVGMPFDGDPRAGYALIREDGEVEHRRVPYGHVEAAADLRARFPGPWAPTVAGRIEQATPTPG